MEESLKKLRTNYIDLLYVHWWDWETSVEEVMRALNVLIQQGKVLYLVGSKLIVTKPPQLSPGFIGRLGYSGLDCFQG